MHAPAGPHLSGSPPADHAPVPSRRQERVPPQASHGAHDRRHRRRDHGLRPPAHDRRRMVRRRQRKFQRAAHHAELRLARLLAAAHLRAEDPAGARRAVGVVGELVRRRLHLGAQLLPAVRDRRADLPRHVPRVRAVAGRAQGVPDRPQGRDRRAQARRPVRLEGRRRDSAARHDLHGHLELHAARHLRRRGQGGRPVDDVLPLGPPERDDQEALPAPRRPDRRVHRAAPRSRARRPRCRRRSTPCSGTRSPRR